MPKKILLADDSITIQKVVELTFSDGDYEVTAVNNGAKAIQKLSEMRPDIILSDIIMPEKNGYEVCEYVKSHPEFRNIPVILLTGTFEPFDPDRAEKAGCDAVVTKPFESQSLIHKVEELIAQSRATTAAAAPNVEEAPAASPWEEEAPPPPPSPFTTSSGKFPAPEDPFEHGSDIFNAPPPPANATTEMPFDTPSDAPFGAPPPVEEFSGETRAFPKMTFDEMQQMEATPPPPPPAPEPEPSPWDEPASTDFAPPPPPPPPPAPTGSETQAIPKMSIEEMQQSLAPEAEAESPFGEPPPVEEFSGETRAFPKMTFDEMQQMETEQEAPPPPEAPPAPEPSPWDEPAGEVAMGGETRAFPKMTFDEMLAAQPAEPSPWDEPQPIQADTASWETPPAWSPAEEAEEAPAAESYAEPMPEEGTPFAEEAMSAPEDMYAEVPQPESEPSWAPEAEAEAVAESEEPPIPSPALAPETPSIPIASARDLTDEQVDRIARRVVELMSDHVVRNIAWEVIPDLAEMVVKERIRQLESEA